MFNLKILKKLLMLKKFIVLFELRIKNNKYYYRLSLFITAIVSWKKKIILLEFNKKYNKAIDLCNTKLSNSDSIKNLAFLYESIGRNLRNLNQLDDALYNLEKAQKLNLPSASLDYEIGLIYFLKRNYSLARQSMESAIENGYDTAPLRIHLGKIYYQMGMYNKAEKCFKRVLNIYPNEGSLYFLLGIVYKSKIEYQLAIEAFKNAIKYGSNQKEEHLGLAEIYTRLGYWKNAIDEYKNILIFEPNSFTAHYFLGWIYEIQGFADKAIGEYLLANKINPDDKETQERLTQLLSAPVQTN